MQDMKITRARVKNHFTYSWWKYMLLACLAIFGWNLIYSSSAYRPPKDKRMDVYFVTYTVAEETLTYFKDEIMARYPELEDAAVLSINFSEEDSYYGSMQLTTYVGAGEGDLYILPRERFRAFAEGDAFYPLDEAIASGALDLRGTDVSSATVTTESGERGVYGIPLTDMYGLMEYGIDNRDLVACVMSYSEVPERGADWLNWLIETMQAPKPDWLVEYEAERAIDDTEAEDIPSF